MAQIGIAKAKAAVMGTEKRELTQEIGGGRKRRQGAGFKSDRPKFKLWLYHVLALGY